MILRLREFYVSRGELRLNTTQNGARCRYRAVPIIYPVVPDSIEGLCCISLPSSGEDVTIVKQLINCWVPKETTKLGGRNIRPPSMCYMPQVSSSTRTQFW